MKSIKSNPLALIPIYVFLALYLGSGIYFEYINPKEGQMGFYIMPVVVAFSIALGVALFQNKSLKFDEKIKVCAKGIGDENIIIMIFIFLMAGAFSGIASATGGAASISNLLLSIIPDKFLIPGLFIIACLISMAMGSSVGTITILVLIATAVSQEANLLVPLCVSTVVGGAMFGDNLSFISDTTIAATKTQGVNMKDKFRENFKIALPAAIITLAILIVYSFTSNSGSLEVSTFNFWQTIPYFIVLILSLVGINVFIVLGVGTVLFSIIGLISGELNFINMFSAFGNGTTSMFETIIVTILVAAIGALIKANGGFATILDAIRKKSKGKKGGMFGIAILTVLMDIATANNTVAIIMAAPIAKNISEEYDINPRKTASLLDTFSCVAQGIIPYGAQLLIASKLAGLSSVSLIPWLFYPFILCICLIISIIFAKRKAS